MYWVICLATEHIDENWDSWFRHKPVVIFDDKDAAMYQLHLCLRGKGHSDGFYTIGAESRSLEELLSTDNLV